MIGPRNVLEYNVLIVVHKVVKRSRAKRKTGHTFSGHDHLQGIVYHSALDERKYAVGHRLGVQSKVSVVAQSPEHGIGNAAHTYLQRGTIGYQFGNILPDTALCIGRNGRRYLDQRIVHLDARIKAADMYERVAVGVRHLLVDLRYNGLGTLDGRESQVGRDAVAAIAVTVGG